ncbi:glutathione-disulfide reductase [Oceaniserpentilla sp. 4NH20-0058]|uniref:glutathione-disulfide reductase n=1 Tax=Oceaniserpentilla sp. 4NH20-0058 TaxID=3127660 RepID=UPI00310C1EAA
MSKFDFDLFVIGAGSAGVRVSRMAAAMGRRVAVAESRYLGGTCVNVGCVPKKLFVYASEFPHMINEAKGYGLNLNLNGFNWNTLRDNKTKEIERLNGIYQNLLDGSNVTTKLGHASLVDSNTVTINGEHFTAEKIILATGGWPDLPEIPGKEFMVNSNDFFYLESFPQTALVVGSGYISVEFAGILNGLGCKTSISSRSGKLLRGFDESTREFAENEILKKGLTLIKEQPIKITKEEEGYRVEFNNQPSILVDLVVAATGRNPNLQNLGLENVNIALDDGGFIKVNEQYQTSTESIYALGDLIDTPQLTPVALAEAMTFLRQQYEGNLIPLDYTNIPTAVFSQPNLATVGMTEQEAIQKGYKVKRYESEFRALKLTMTDSTERTYMKLIVDNESDKVLGAHMVGEHAAEIIQGIVIAIKAGATKAVFDETIGIHPSSAEEFVTMRNPS